MLDSLLPLIINFCPRFTFLASADFEAKDIRAQISLLILTSCVTLTHEAVSSFRSGDDNV